MSTTLQLLSLAVMQVAEIQDLHLFCSLIVNQTCESINDRRKNIYCSMLTENIRRRRGPLSWVILLSAIFFQASSIAWESLVNNCKTTFILFLYSDSKTMPLVSSGEFHHVCITMQYSNGPLLVYVDGLIQANVMNVEITGGLPGGGIWVIGQDQDSLGGGFEKANAFSGELTELHVWDRVLSPAEVKHLASSCAANMTGNYLAYSDFVIKGNVERFQPPCCGRHSGNN